MPNKLFMLALPIGMALLAPITSPAAHAADASQAATGSYEQLAAQAEGRIGDPEFDYQLGMAARSEEHTSELQSLMRISYAVFCLKKKNRTRIDHKAKRLHQTLQ